MANCCPDLAIQSVRTPPLRLCTRLLARTDSVTCEDFTVRVNSLIVVYRIP